MATAFSANAEYEEPKSSEFAKRAFQTLHTLPRTDIAIATSRGFFEDDREFLKFIRANFQAPNVGIASIDGLSVTYSFTGKNDVFSITGNEGKVYVGFSAIQNIKLFEKELGNKCVIVSMDVTIPFGFDTSTGSKIKDMKTVMAPMEECVKDAPTSNGVPQ
jgi:hypothetical protein